MVIKKEAATMAARKIMTPVEIQAFSEKIIDTLTGLPVQHALDVLRMAERNLLWLATVKKPETPLDAHQIDLEEAIKAKSTVAILDVKSRKKSARA